MRKRRINHQGHATLSNCADLGNGKGDLIGGKGHRFGVEVPTRNNAPVFFQDQRVIGNRIGFDLKRLPGKAQQIHGGAGDLWLATDAIGVLNAGIAFAVAFADFRTFHQIAHCTRHIDLAGMSTKSMDFINQRGGRAHDCIGRK